MELLIELLNSIAPEVRLKFPEAVIVPVAVLIPVPLMVRWLKLLAPIVLADPPLKLIVDPVEVNVPLFVQFPPTVCVNAPPLNVVPEPIVKLPVTANVAKAVAEEVPDREKFPYIARAEPGSVFVPLPLRIRW
jgi:hypothetical protein